MSKFVTIDTIVSRVLLEIGDENNRRYYLRAAQWALDAFRRINVNHSPFYLERKITLDPMLYYAEYPKDLVKLLSVGVYRNGEFWSFTRKPDMSIFPLDAEDNIHEPDQTESQTIPMTGGKFGRSGSNIGYYVEDPEQGRFFVRNFRKDAQGSPMDTTSNILDKVIIRYKTTGVDCNGDICVPTEAQDLIVSMVYYKFIQKSIPMRVTADVLDRTERELNSLQEEYEALMYEPHNFWEYKDAIFRSLNSTARR